MIPVANIYYLLIYAWDMLEESETLDVVAEECESLAELLALVLSRGTERVIRRGLDRGYLPQRETIAGIRGKLCLAESLKSQALVRGRATCEFDELSHDILANRIVATTLRRLLRRPDLDAKVAEEVAATCYRLSQVAEIAISDRVFRRVQVHRNNQAYRLLLDVCRLIHRSGLLREEAGPVTFRDFIRDEARMRRLFERFVRNFVRHEAHWLRLEPPEVKWRGLAGEPDAVNRVPRMRTDFHATGEGRRLVIETKFVPELFQTGLGGKKTLRSPHLYQLHAYLTNLEPVSQLPVEGVLLYPAAGHRHDLRFAIGNQKYRVATLELNQPWRCVREDLLGILRSERTIERR